MHPCWIIEIISDDYTKHEENEATLKTIKIFCTVRLFSQQSR